MVMVELLERPEFLITENERRCITHIAFCLTVIPYAYWPVKANIVKGFLDRAGKFHPVIKSQRRIFLSREEFESLLKPMGTGKARFHMEFRELAKLIQQKTNPVKVTRRPGQQKRHR